MYIFLYFLLLLYIEVLFIRVVATVPLPLFLSTFSSPKAETILTHFLSFQGLSLHHKWLFSGTKLRDLSYDTMQMSCLSRNLCKEFTSSVFLQVVPRTWTRNWWHWRQNKEGGCLG